MNANQTKKRWKQNWSHYKVLQVSAAAAGPLCRQWNIMWAACMLIAPTLYFCFVDPAASICLQLIDAQDIAEYGETFATLLGSYQPWKSWRVMLIDILLYRRAKPFSQFDRIWAGHGGEQFFFTVWGIVLKEVSLPEAHFLSSSTRLLCRMTEGDNVFMKINRGQNCYICCNMCSSSAQVLVALHASVSLTQYAVYLQQGFQEMALRTYVRSEISPCEHPQLPILGFLTSLEP